MSVKCLGYLGFSGRPRSPGSTGQAKGAGANSGVTAHEPPT